MNAQDTIKTICSETASRVKVSDLCDYIQSQLAKRGMRCSVVNGKGIDLPDRKHDWFNTGTIWFRRDNANDCWIAFTVVNGETVRI